MRHVARLAVWGLVGVASAAPGRHIDYAESPDRLVFAFVYGSQDHCKVVRRRVRPRIELEQILQRPPRAAYRLAPDEKLVAHFSFGGRGRPVHIVPSNDARYLVAFANRAPRGAKPAQDAVWHLREKNYAPRVEYAFDVESAVKEYPKLSRALRPAKDKPLPRVDAANYAFLSRIRDDLMLVARRSENRDGFVGEIVGFSINLKTQVADVALATDALAWLLDPEPLWRAAGAWALARRPDEKHAGALRTALGSTRDPVARAHIAGALLACGDGNGRKALSSLLSDADPNARRVAAFALLRAGARTSDVDALAACVARSATAEKGSAAAVAGEIAQRALAHAGASGVRALIKASRSDDPTVRARLARALGRVDGADAERRLLALGRDDDDSVLRAVAIALTAPPRRLLAEHAASFARVIDNARKRKHEVAGRRLAVLAAHAKLQHKRVLAALVALATVNERAIWALNKLTGQDLKTARAYQDWWKRQ